MIAILKMKAARGSPASELKGTPPVRKHAHEILQKLCHQNSTDSSRETDPPCLGSYPHTALAVVIHFNKQAFAPVG